MSLVRASNMSDSVLGQYLIALAWDKNENRLRSEYANLYDDSLAQMNNCLIEASNSWVYSHNQEIKGKGSHQFISSYFKSFIER